MSKYEARLNHVRDSAIAMGDRATANQRSQTSISPVTEAATELKRLIKLIKANKDILPDAERVEQSAVDARHELKKKKPDLGRVRAALTQIMTAVSGVSVLADAALKIQSLISHL